MNDMYFQKQLEAYLPEKFGVAGTISQQLQQCWIDKLKSVAGQVSDMSWYKIYENLCNQHVEGIDTETLIASASILSYYNDSIDMATDIQSSACFMMFMRKKKEFGLC